MRLNGDWSLCDDGIVRPVIRAEVLANDGSWVRAELLVDTGADRTVLSASIWMLLGLPPVATHDRISGVGGLVDTVVVETRIRLSRDDGGALDQLSDADHARNLAWLPPELPEHVRLIVTTVPGDCLDTLQHKLPASCPA